MTYKELIAEIEHLFSRPQIFSSSYPFMVKNDELRYVRHHASSWVSWAPTRGAPTESSNGVV
jgi:hypothetical protein